MNASLHDSSLSFSSTMHISKEMIDNIAQLSRLEFPEAEKAAFVEKFEQIIEYFNALEAIDLTGVEPLKSIADTGENSFREDVSERPITTAEALSNAPKHNSVFFKVPKVLG